MEKSIELFSRAKAVMPGGVNSPVRSFTGVGGDAVYFKSAMGQWMKSVDNREYLDFCGSWGPLILGHADTNVISAVKAAVSRGLGFGTNTEVEVEMAELITSIVPVIEKLRLVNSGTEAVMSAIRLARGYTGKNKIIKFNGCYHGHVDYLLVSAGSGLLTGGGASSDGIPQTAVDDVYVAEYNSIENVEKIIKNDSDAIAAVIVEPIAGNMGMVPPLPGFLESLRKITEKNNILLIFDEVISGFRIAPTTYSTVAGINPDLICLGKILGGGLPIGGFGGRGEIMDHLSPLGNVYQAGTLSGNPVAVTAGLATLKTLIDINPYEKIEKLSKKLEGGMGEISDKINIDFHIARKGGMFTPFFRKKTVRNLKEAKECNLDNFKAFFHGLLDEGIYIPPSQFETAFISAAHTEEDVDMFIDKAGKVLYSIKKKRQYV